MDDRGERVGGRRAGRGVGLRVDDGGTKRMQGGVVLLFERASERAYLSAGEGIQREGNREKNARTFLLLLRYK